MEKVLFAVDELTGLIGAAVIMRPSKSVMDFEVKSLKKKFKDKRFAAGCNRDVIRQGAELCGFELDELFSRTIDAMKANRAPTATPSASNGPRGPVRARGPGGAALPAGPQARAITCVRDAPSVAPPLLRRLTHLGFG